MNILLKNAAVVNWFPSRVDRNTDLLVSEGRIKRIGRGLEKPTLARTIDCTDKIVAPGFVCGHTHLYSALSRGILASIKPSSDFVSQLRNLWWRLDRAIDEKILRYSALIGALDAVRSGSTSVIDHHASPSFIIGSLAIIKEAFERVGLRGILCYETTDRNGPDGMREGVRENVEFARLVDAGPRENRLVEASIGGHAPFTLNDEAIGLLADAVRTTGRGFHVHAAEDRYDSSHSHALYGKDITERLHRAGLLTPKTILVHGVSLTEADISRINDADCFLAHNARSNMNNHVGYNGRLSSIRTAVLGTDGIGADMFEEFRFAFFKHRDAGGHLWPPDFLRIIHNGNEILGRYFPERFGQMEEGYAADLMILDYLPPTPFVKENLAGHLAFGLSSRSVETVIIGGKVVMENRKFALDLPALYREAEQEAARLWRRMDELPD
jgi:putative selenium metabolism protein SsnA